MVERRPKIRITVIDRRGKLGCHRGHHVGEVFDFDEDRGRICPMVCTVPFPISISFATAEAFPDNLWEPRNSAALTQILSWSSGRKL